MGDNDLTKRCFRSNVAVETVSATPSYAADDAAAAASAAAAAAAEVAAASFEDVVESSNLNLQLGYLNRIRYHVCNIYNDSNSTNHFENPKTSLTNTSKHQQQ
jgi:hypothetical protein